MPKSAPLMEFDPDGTAPILSYNVPEPTQYTGRNLVFLELEEDCFREAVSKPPDKEQRLPVEQLKAMSERELLALLRVGDRAAFPNIVAPAATHAALFSAQIEVGASRMLNTATTSVLSKALRSRHVRPNLEPLVEPGMATEKVDAVSLPPALLGSALTAPALHDGALRPRLPDLDPAHIAEQAHAGKRLNVYRSLWGDYAYNFLEPPPERAKPRFVLVETYRLTSYLGAFGAGRTVNAFSLLPGEKTTISVKTFRHSEIDRKSASSILDSCTQESADDFENTVQNENSDKQNRAESFEYHAEAEASASWGWGSAKVSGGVKGGTSSAREEFAKNVSSAVSKHAQKASAKRDVQVDTSAEVKESSGEETAIVREIQNVNSGRTLNFVCRQLNQEHIAILHLVDVRIGFFNGYAESAREVPLSQLAALLKEVVKEGSVDQARQALQAQLETLVADAQVNPAPELPFIEEHQVADGDGYQRINPRCVSIYTDETGNEIRVPGLIASVSKVTMRTDGVIVDSLLGQGNALDPYAAGLRAAELTQRDLQNKGEQANLDREVIARGLVANHDKVGADVYRELFEPEPGDSQ